MINYIKNIQIYLFYSLPFSYIFSVFILDFSISIIALSFLFLLFKDENKKYSNWLLILFSTWWIYLMISSILSEDIFFSLKSSFFYIRFGLFAFATWYIFENKHFSLSLFFKIYFIFILILVLSAIVEMVFFNESYFNTTNTRLSGFFYDEMVLGEYLSIASFSFVAIFAYLYNKNSYKYLIVFSALSILISIIFLSGERSAFISSLLSIVIILILSVKSKRTFLFSVAIFCLFIYSVITLNVDSKNRMFNYTIIQLKSENISNAFSFKGFNLLPIDYYEKNISAYKMFLDKPFTGHGPNMYRKVCSDKKYISQFSCSTHPHSTYLQLLSETGIVGITPIILIFLYLNYKFFLQLLFVLKIQQKEIFKFHELLVIVPFYIFLFPFIPSMNFFNNWNSILIYLLIGFILYFINNRSEAIN